MISVSGLLQIPILLLERFVEYPKWISLALVVVLYGLLRISIKYYRFRTSILRKLPRPARQFSFLFGAFLDIIKEPYMEPHLRWWNEAQAAYDTSRKMKTKVLDEKVNDDSAVDHIPFYVSSGILGRYSIIVLDADIIQTILCDPSVSKDNIRFVKRYEYIKILLGQGLVPLEGTSWSRHRRIIQPFFQMSVLEKKLDETVPKLTNELIGYWKQGGQKNKSGDCRIIIDLDTHLQALTLDVIGQAGFSYNFDALKSVQKWSISDEAATNKELENIPTTLSTKERNNKIKSIGAIQIDHPFVKALSKRLLQPSMLELVLLGLNSMWMLPYINPWVMKKQNALDEAATVVVEQAKESLLNASIDANSKDTTNGKSLLQLLLNASLANDANNDDNNNNKRNTLSSTELRDEVKTFLIAGHETTSTLCYWALHVLSKEPEIQEKVYQNIIEHANSLDDDTIGIEQVEKMEYLDAFLNEVLRFYSPVGMLFRYNTKEEYWNGYTIPKNTRILLPMYLIHRHPKYWGPDATVFRPERWFENDPSYVAKRHPLSFVPFSAGGRNCIGHRFARIEAKIIIANIVRTLVIQPAPGMPKDITMTSVITVKSKPVIKICVEERTLSKGKDVKSEKKE